MPAVILGFPGPTWKARQKRRVPTSESPGSAELPTEVKAKPAAARSKGIIAAQGWLSYDYKSADQVHEAARDGERRRETASNAHLRGLAPPSEFSLSQGPGLVLPPARLFLVLWRADAAR